MLGDTRDVAGSFDLYFASRDRDKARSYCEKFGGAGWFGSYEEAAASPDVQAIYCLTPHDLHVDNALLAAAHSKHVLMEKPVARTVEEALRMRRAAAEAGVKLMVAENHRFLPTVVRAKELLDSGDIGDLRAINMTCDSFGDTGGWRNSLETAGGGSFIDAGIHYVDTLVHLGGMPELLYAAAPRGYSARRARTASPSSLTCRAAPSPRSSSRTERVSAGRDSRSSSPERKRRSSSIPLATRSNASRSTAAAPSPSAASAAPRPC